jgi:ATP-dependent RNA helicase RhlE
MQPSFCDVLERVGFKEPTPIQAQAIPYLLNGRDLLGVAQTGTGKTAAFALPTLQRLVDENLATKARFPRALILAPTRELVLQIREELDTFSQATDLEHTIVIGGVGQNPQVKALARGIDVLVATPGRLLDLARARHVDLSEVSVLILDEADRLLDMGFIRDVKRIVAMTPKTRQSLLFSATMPREVTNLASEMLIDPVRVDVSPKQVTVLEIEQRVVHVANADKQRALELILHQPEVTRAIVFTRTKHGANKVAKKLVNAGISAEAIHGNKSQNARQRALENFSKGGDAWVLVATDIAARGIDISGVSHVFNFELPHEPESYVHRIGRTGRAGATGAAWALVDPEEVKRLRAVERLIKMKLPTVTLDLPAREVGEAQQAPEQGSANHTKGSGANSNRGRGNGQQQGRRSSGGNGMQGQSANGGNRRRGGRSRPAAAAGASS